LNVATTLRAVHVIVREALLLWSSNRYVSTMANAAFSIKGITGCRQVMCSKMKQIWKTFLVWKTISVD